MTTTETTFHVGDMIETKQGYIGVIKKFLSLQPTSTRVVTDGVTKKFELVFVEYHQLGRPDGWIESRDIELFAASLTTTNPDPPAAEEKREPYVDRPLPKVQNNGPSEREQEVWVTLKIPFYGNDGRVEKMVASALRSIHLSVSPRIEMYHHELADDSLIDGATMVFPADKAHG